ncbi:hypothetical protein NQ317_014536 [Molorchus minor]|uniref:Rab-GAP TBC domain-containing protein n=1 Tax=Molorchus minor TaxID=1323400 RepID=A0ABQ9ITI8_9CUCU|nr:hypothetical protein NQ317_014536 [Molorchus minor]
MSGVFGYSREAVRVKVKKCEGSQPPEMRKFSVDPQITSFEVLQSILAKAFDLKGDFAICYRVYDISGHETYMPLLSDWDLDAAFLKAYNTAASINSEPCLCLRVDLKPFEECSDDWEIRQNLPIITQIRTITSQEAKPSPRLHGIFNHPLILVRMEVLLYSPPRPPLSDSEFRKFLDPVGQIVYAKELRSVIYFGGIDPSLRKVVWKHLLNVYPEGMTGRERMDYIKKKALEYVGLRETWKTAIAQGPVAGELAYTTGMVRKDVLRTDRHHPFYAGSDDNQNIASLFNILTTYALNHPKVSYCQGMSDLASPLLVTMNDEAHAYICFCALMQRLSTNFMIDGIAMTQKFTHLAEGLMYYDPEFYNYLKLHQADDLLFCYRWLLLEMKREFAFEDSLRMLEVLWSSFPLIPGQGTETVQHSVSASNHIDTTYQSLNNKFKHQSLDDSALIRSRNKSNDVSPKSLKTGGSTKDDSSSKSSDLLPITPISPKSPNETLRPRSVSPLEQKSDSVVFNNRINSHQLQNKRSSNLKDKIATAKLFSSLDRLDATQSIKEEEEKEAQRKNEKEVDESKLDLLESEVKEVFDKLRYDDIFIWENPLHQTSPSTANKNIFTHTPDEQADIDYDTPSIVNETSATKTVTPIRILNQTSKDNTTEPNPAEDELTQEVQEPITALPKYNITVNGTTPAMTNSCEEVTESHRDHIISKGMDYNEMAMHFDKMVRRHNVIRVLNQARQMYARYIKQHSIAHQKIELRNEDC